MNRNDARNDTYTTLQDMLLTMQVQIEEAHLAQCRSDWRDIDYCPSYNKLYYILDGEGWIKIGDLELYPNPGQLILMPAHVVQSYSVLEGKPFLKYWCHFRAVAGGGDVFQWLDVPYCYDGLSRPEVERLFGELVNAHRSSTLAARLKEKSVLLHLLSDMMEGLPLQVQKGQSHEMERLTLIQQFVDRHLHKDLTLEEMADVAHLHPNYFSKYFKRHFGMPPLKYVSRKKMDRAKLLLKTTNQSVKEIAIATGFEDANYFSKTFRREVGYSPTEYRVGV